MDTTSYFKLSVSWLLFIIVTPSLVASAIVGYGRPVVTSIEESFNAAIATSLMVTLGIPYPPEFKTPLPRFLSEIFPSKYPIADVSH